MLFWLMGDLSHADHSGAAWLLLALVLLVFTFWSGSLNALALGALKAARAGRRGERIAGGAVFRCGARDGCGGAARRQHRFRGLDGAARAAPHGRQRHRRLLPASALAGGSFVALADTFARTVWAPQQLPVGVFTALLGVPVLLFLLSRKP